MHAIHRDAGLTILYVRACVRECVRACVRACLCARVPACLRAQLNSERNSNPNFDRDSSVAKTLTLNLGVEACLYQIRMHDCGTFYWCGQTLEMTWICILMTWDMIPWYGQRLDASFGLAC